MLSPWFALIACSRVEQAPDGWPDDGCAAEHGSVDRWRERDLRLEVPDGTRLAVTVLWPRPAACRSAVVLVPPGFTGGTRLLDGQQAQDLALAGRVVVAWDPRGRGDSEGTEDVNGSVGQDDLAEVLRWAAWQDDVDPSTVVLASRSFGGALAAGALSRHPELAPVGWLDVESPGWLSQDLAYASDHNREVFDDLLGEGDPDAFWAEREPAGFMEGVTVPYRRIQGLPDHALGQYLGHARAMVDHATSAPEVRYNGVLVVPPLGEERAYDLAVDGGVEADGELVTEAILEVR